MAKKKKTAAVKAKLETTAEWRAVAEGINQGTIGDACIIRAQERDLTDLAVRIRGEHEAVCRSARQTLQHALATGDLLLEAKAIVGHGKWGEWLRDHCEMSDRSAQVYMQLARNREAIEAKSAGTADLSIEAALAALAKPTPTESEARPTLDAPVADEDPAASAEERRVYAEPPAIGGQAIDLGPAAPAQLTEKLLPDEGAAANLASAEKTVFKRITDAIDTVASVEDLSDVVPALASALATAIVIAKPDLAQVAKAVGCPWPLMRRPHGAASGPEAKPGTTAVL